MKKERLKVFYQLGVIKNLGRSAGDSITEMNIIKAISKFADVDNDETKKYDIYYVRNNIELFMKLPSPKIYYASPYSEVAHRCATAISTQSDSWTRHLKDSDIIGHSGTTPCKKVFTIHQVLDNIFKPLQNHPKTKTIRKDIGGDFIIGHFGSTRRSSYPYSFLHILPRLKERYPKLKVLFGRGRVQINKTQEEYVIQRDFDYTDMPYVISACDLILYNMRTDNGHIVGSNKLLEAMACGIPVLAPRLEARVEMLGKRYELFHPYEPNNGRYPERIEKIMFEKICKIIDDKELRKKISKQLIKRAKFYSLDESAKRLEVLFRGLL